MKHEEFTVSNCKTRARRAGLVAKGVAAALMVCMNTMAFAQDPGSGLATSVHAAQDIPLQLDPHSKFWRDAGSISFEGDNYGDPVPSLRTVVRSRWTDNNLYLLFICPYQALYLKPSPETDTETNELWNWDVAEIFIGSDFQDIRHYKEFELSPQGEWVDLDIDLDHPHQAGGWGWNSGFKVVAHIDAATKTWYGAMRIPFQSIDPAAPHAGGRYRVNFFRAQGPPPDRQLLAWRNPNGKSFHVPEQFGILQLTK